MVTRSSLPLSSSHSIQSAIYEFHVIINWIRTHIAISKRLNRSTYYGPIKHSSMSCPLLLSIRHRISQAICHSGVQYFTASLTHDHDYINPRVS